MPSSAHAPDAAEQCELLRWVVSSQAIAALEMANPWQTPQAADVARLRALCSPRQAGLVLEQVALRRRATAKFSRAQQMFFTTLGLEQATDEAVARYKATAFVGRGRVFDLCTGIGGDLVALAERGEVTGVDRDPAMTIVAEANASACHTSTGNTSAALVRIADVREVDIQAAGAWHIDPDRRPHGKRTTHAAWHEPPTDVIDQLLERNPHAAIKLAPAAVISDAWTQQARLEWISRGRECRQLVAWFGDLGGRAGECQATMLGSGKPPRTVRGPRLADPPIAEQIGRYICEPDAAVLAAKLAGTLAHEHGLLSIAPRVAYLTSDRLIDDPALACFEIRELLPARAKKLRSLLRERDVGRLEIKKRGIEVDPAALIKQLDLRGEQEATLILTRIAGQATAILARRVT